MSPVNPLLRSALPLIVAGLLAGPLPAQNLEIHYINVGWGGSVLVRGPSGTTVLLEAGKSGMGENRIVPYLTSIGIPPSAGLDYIILGHKHSDHSGGLDEIIEAGYDVHVANYENGSPEASSSFDSWVSDAQGTTAGAPVPMPVGTVIQLGNGATMTCIARMGHFIGGGSVFVDSENERSIGLLVKHGGFDFLWASDMYGGDADEECTGRSYNGEDVETPMIQAISPGGASPLITAGGIDVLHVNHHGSDAGTNSNYMNLSRPAVALISVGAGQSSDAQRPRRVVVENVLLAEAPCVTVPPALVLQTEEGNPTGSQTSFAGYCVGNILVSTNGVSTFTVSADGAVTVGPDERTAAGLPLTIPLDEAGGGGPADTDPPVLSPAQVTAVAATSATIAWTSDENSTSIVRYGPTNFYGSTASSGGYVTSHSVTLAGLAQGAAYHYRVESADGPGNTTLGQDGTFTTGTSANYVPTSSTILQGSLKSGTYANLATNNGSYYRVNSTTSGTKKSDWYGSVSVPTSLSSGATLTATYSGKYSKTVTQTLHLWDWSASAWVQFDSRSVGSSEKLVTFSTPSAATYVSATGEIRLRVLGTGGSSNFYCSGDWMQFTLESEGSAP